MTWIIPCRHMALRLSIALGAALFSGLGALALTPVDLELVLAVDVSGSVEFEEAALQRDGYIQAISSPEFAKAVAGGVLGRIAVTYVEWAGEDVQATDLDWHVIDGAASAAAFARSLAAAPISTGPWTSISDAIIYAVPLLEGNQFQGTRRVIDIFGDGPNNTGALVTGARADAIAKGITINGLPIINDRLQPSGRPQLQDLDRPGTSRIPDAPSGANCCSKSPTAGPIWALPWGLTVKSCIRRRCVIRWAVISVNAACGSADTCLMTIYDKCDHFVSNNSAK